MIPLKQSFSWWCFAKKVTDSARFFKQAAALGFQGVDLIDEPLWPQVADAGLAIAAIAGHGTINEGLNRRENAARIAAELQVNIAKAAQWKIPVLICFAGSREGVGDEQGLVICAEMLARVAPWAEQAGVKLAVELLNSKVDHPGYQADHTAWGIRLCDEVASRAVGLLYDIYHMQVMEGDIIRTITDHHRHFVHYHTAGHPGRGLMDENQELNYPPIYRAIAATGYEGYVGHEFLCQGDPLEDLRFAYRQCEQSLSA